MSTHLKRAEASVIILQFGRSEALEGLSALPRFATAYEKLLDDCLRQTSRLVLVTPPPFEQAGGALPDLSLRNADLAVYAEAIRTLAGKRKLPCIDLFSELTVRCGVTTAAHRQRLSTHPHGQAWVARAFARQLGFGNLADRAGQPDEKGAWPNPSFENLRQCVVAKNRLWFDYWRPQSWAFLGGDRIEQPSSRDLNLKVRWFPDEMEKFVPLIQAQEREMAILAEKAR